ncbi:MAG: hypothetical protein HLUCCA04_08750 [Oceanicaulis sp. HLUCCA04]|nr:MAG: hypothetical protein HLUCCA04_08750 [Oceanicaulis sp. HLUCCA04]
MASISGMVSPVVAEQITGIWRAGACELILTGNAMRGAASASGNCQHGVENVAGWVIDTGQRTRIALLDQAGDELWAGVYTRAERLSGMSARGGALEFAR